jgi:hypothetical protein
MGALDTKVGDIGGARFRHAQPVQGEQAGKSVVAGRGGLGRGQEPDRLLAVKPKRLRITRHRGATNVGDGGVGEGFLLDHVTVETGQSGQPPSQGGATAASPLQLADVGLDVAAAHRVQPALVVPVADRGAQRVQVAVERRRRSSAPVTGEPAGEPLRDRRLAKLGDGQVGAQGVAQRGQVPP